MGQKGEWETMPFGGHPGVRKLEVHNCGHNRGGKMGGGCGTSLGTQRELSEEFAGGALKIVMGMSRCSKGGLPEGGQTGRARGPVCRMR